MPSAVQVPTDIKREEKTVKTAENPKPNLDLTSSTFPREREM